MRKGSECLERFPHLVGVGCVDRGDESGLICSGNGGVWCLSRYGCWSGRRRCGVWRRCRRGEESGSEEGVKNRNWFLKMIRR